MSKVVAPLQSFSASGKIGKSIVFFSHLGRNIVRGLVTPSNPQTAAQGGVRLMLGALGRATKGVSQLSTWFADAKQTIPAGQTWVSQFVTSGIQAFGSGAAGVTALNAALTAHTETDAFEAEGLAMGLTTVTIPYAASPGTITPGAQLYALARHTMDLAAANPTLFDRVPYTTALVDWSSANVGAFKTDLTT